MSKRDATELAADDRDGFLGTGGTGVIALATGEGEPPHSVPVSYGYDATDETFYFRLAAGPESAKGELEGRAATFVVHGSVDDRWHSVVARGRLEPTDGEDVGPEALAGLDRVHIPYVDVFGEPLAEVTFEFYRLAPADLTARVESVTPG